MSLGQGSLTVYLDKTDYQVAENGKTLYVKVLLSGTSGQTVSVSLKTEQHTATANVDYVAAGEAGQQPKVVTFLPGATEQTVTIDITDDTWTEGNETLSVTLYSPVNCSLGSPSSAAVTILDEEAPPPPPPPTGTVRVKSVSFSGPDYHTVYQDTGSQSAYSSPPALSEEIYDSNPRR